MKKIESLRSSDDEDLSDGDTSEAKQGRSSASEHNRWPDLDKQHLLAYKKDCKFWEWIFGKFPWEDSAYNTYALEYGPAREPRN